MEEALRLSHISKSYPKFTLKDVDLVIPKGSIMGFIGENGAGKSTTMKAMLGLIRPDSGTVYVDGKKFTGCERDMKEHIGVVMDSACFSGELNAKEIGSIMRRIYRTWDEARFGKLLREYKIEETKKVKEYSRGMKMKLSIVVALSHDSKLLVLDEATSGLDPVVRDALLDTFLAFIQNEEHSVWLSSHILSDLEKVCDYITFIQDGKILFSENKDELMEKYQIVKGSAQQIGELAPSSLVGVQENEFGAQALVLSDEIPDGMVCDRPSIEDIMLFHVKGGK